MFIPVGTYTQAIFQVLISPALLLATILNNDSISQVDKDENGKVTEKELFGVMVRFFKIIYV